MLFFLGIAYDRRVAEAVKRELQEYIFEIGFRGDIVIADGFCTDGRFYALFLESDLFHFDEKKYKKVLKKKNELLKLYP